MILTYLFPKVNDLSPLAKYLLCTLHNLHEIVLSLTSAELSPLPSICCVLYTTYMIQFYLWLAVDLKFSPSNLISSTNNTDPKDVHVNEIFFKVCLSTYNPLDLQLPMQLVSITSKVVSLKPVHFCQWLAIDRWFSPGTLVSSINKIDCHDITEILSKVALNTIHQPQPYNPDIHIHVITLDFMYYKVRCHVTHHLVVLVKDIWWRRLMP